MADYNNVTIVGRLTKDIETKTFNSDLVIADFSVAVNTYTKKETYVNFFDVSAFGKAAENAAKFLRKGSLCLVSGKLKQERWEKDGKTQSKIKIIATDIQYLTPKKDVGEDVPENMTRNLGTNELPF